MWRFCCFVVVGGGGSGGGGGGGAAAAAAAAVRSCLFVITLPTTHNKHTFGSFDRFSIEIARVALLDD